MTTSQFLTPKMKLETWIKSGERGHSQLSRVAD